MNKRKTMRKSALFMGATVALFHSMGGLAMAADGVAVSIDPESCRQLTTLIGDGGAYVSGKDADGNDVVPAEGPATPGTASNADLAKLANNTTIYLGIDVAKRLGLTGRNQALSGDMALGTITVQDGQAFINGKPIASGDDPALVAACKKAFADQ